MANVFAITGLVTLVAIGSGGLALLVMLLFPSAATHAATVLGDKLKKQCVTGFIAIVVGCAGFAIFLYFRHALAGKLSSVLDPTREFFSINYTWVTNPRTLVHTLGYILLLPWFVALAVGLAGWSERASEAYRKAFGAVTLRHPVGIIALAIVASCLPLVGWFLFAPIFFLSSLGAGWSALFALAGTRRETT